MYSPFRAISQGRTPHIGLEGSNWAGGGTRSMCMWYNQGCIEPLKVPLAARYVLGIINISQCTIQEVAV